MQKTFEIDDILGLIPAFEGMDGDPELTVAHLGNALSLLHQTLGEGAWVGFYLPRERGLILGAFQGTPACEVIAYDKGVVGACYAEKATIAVSDVTTFPGYICCDAAAKSEICVPTYRDGEVIAVLDIDLPYVHDFSGEEEAFELLARALSSRI